MKATEARPTRPPASLPLLDSIRGSLALLVLIGHAGETFNWPSGALWVDFFIILSGFLMVHHAFLRESREPVGTRGMAKAFYLRRFFRIAPVYYVLLAVFFIGWWPEVRAASVPPAANALLHLSFLFGFAPGGGGPTGMPDWSIGLEMQFYACFPLLALLLWRFRPVLVTLLSAAAAFAAWKLWGVYGPDTPGPLGRFAQPSFLPFMLPLFAAGMSLAWLWWKHPEGGRPWVMAALATACGIAAFEHGHSYLSLGLAALAMALRGGAPTRDLLDQAARLGNRLSDRPVWKRMAELSYAVYLCHPLVQRLLFPHVTGLGLSTWLTFSLLAAATAAGSYLVGFALHVTVEKPIIRWSKKSLGNG